MCSYGQLKLRSHRGPNTCYPLIEVVTKADLAVVYFKLNALNA